MGIGALRRHYREVEVAAKKAKRSKKSEPKGDEGTTAPGAPATASTPPVDGEQVTQPAEGAKTPQTGDSGPERPPVTGAGSSLEAWTAFALASGKTAEDLDGLSRDSIVGLFNE